VELFEDESGKPRGCGIIEFEKNEHALLAMDRMNRYDLKGRKLVVKEVRIILGSSAISLGFLPTFTKTCMNRTKWNLIIFLTHYPLIFVSFLFFDGNKKVKVGKSGIE